jgi:hypothetical protein
MLSLTLFSGCLDEPKLGEGNSNSSDNQSSLGKRIGILYDGEKTSHICFDFITQ